MEKIVLQYRRELKVPVKDVSWYEIDILGACWNNISWLVIDPDVIKPEFNFFQVTEESYSSNAE